MKKLSKICALALTLVLALSLVACANTYPSIKKAFEAEGYTQSETAEAVITDLTNATQGDAKNIAITPHVLIKGGLITGNKAVILEFKATDDMIDYYKNNEIVRDAVSAIANDEDAKTFYNSLVEAGYANGNCLLIPWGISGDAVTEMTTIMKNA